MASVWYLQLGTVAAAVFGSCAARARRVKLTGYMVRFSTPWRTNASISPRWIVPAAATLHGCEPVDDFNVFVTRQHVSEDKRCSSTA